jgi:SAM-dependent methyltransferase
MTRPLRHCPACDARRFAAVGSKNGYEVRRCGDCRSLYAATTPDSAAESYADYYHEGNLEVPPIVRRRLAEIVETLESFRATNRWLDVGCGAGALLDAAANAGWHASGTEVAPEAVDRLAARGRTVFEGDLAELPLAQDAYDVVSLVEVIEHVADPLAVMRRVEELLRPGGVAFITTPHGRGISARLLGTRWTFVCPPEHLQLFSRAGLGVLLRRSGLHLARIKTEGVNPFELARAVRRGEVKSGLKRVTAAYELNATLHRRRGGLLARSLVNAVLSATGLGDGLKSRAIKVDG